MRRFTGILGWPLDHTLSPVMHNAAFRRAGLDWVYLSFEVHPESLGTAVAGLRALGAAGANVTMPHKQKVIEHLDDLSGDARAVGAVNTIQAVGDRLVGHNTDIDGFAALLTEDAGVDPAGMSCLVLGAGGAARAVVRALDRAGAASVTVAARDRERASEVAGLAARSRGSDVPWTETGAAAAAADLVVNATPLGMSGECPVDPGSLHEGHVIVDLVYRPAATPLVEAGRAAGARAWGGLGMLVHQAAASFQIWTGMQAPADVMSAAALHVLTGRR